MAWSSVGGSTSPAADMKAMVEKGKASTALVEFATAEGQVNGSAFCIDRSGLFITNAHVVEGIEPNFVEVKPIIGAFRRMVRDVEFDVCEMAPTTYMIARALGDNASAGAVQQLNGQHADALMASTGIFPRLS